jgi:MFS family permease
MSRVKETTPDLRQRSIVGCTAMAGFVYQFEANLVNVALPTISAQLHIDTYYASLIPIVYIIGTVTVLIAAGKLGGRFGLKRIFILSIALMTLGTIICGLAGCLPVLLGGRLIQGIGAGGMAALGYAIIPVFLPSSLTGYGYGRLSMAAGLGMIAGNPAGGILSQFFPWQFIFLTTIPLMIALIVFSLRNLPDDGKTIVEKPAKIILMDSLFFGLIASCAIIALSFGFEFGFSSTPIIAILLVIAVLAVLLVMRGRRGKISFLPKAMIDNRMFLVSVLGIVVERCVMGGVVFLMPFYLMAFCALPPAATSILMLAYAVGFVMSAPFSGALSDKGQSRTILLTASFIGFCACALFFLFSPGAHWVYALIFLAVIGMADGIYTPSANKTAVGSIPGAEKQHAAVFLPLAVNVGTTLGVSVFEIIFSLPFPKGEAVLHGTHKSGMPDMVLAQGFQSAFLTGAVLWAGILSCIIFIHKRKATTVHVETQR